MTGTKYVRWMTPKQAVEWARCIHKISDQVDLGWTPYNILVTDGAITWKAFYRLDDFRRWMNLAGYKLKITGRFCGNNIGFRTGKLVRE